MTERLGTLKDLGLIDKWIKETMPNSTSCDSMSKILGSHGRDSPSLSLEQVESFFYMVFTGLVLSLLGLVGELASNKWGGNGNARAGQRKPYPKNDATTANITHVGAFGGF